MTRRATAAAPHIVTPQQPEGQWGLWLANDINWKSAVMGDSKTVIFCDYRLLFLAIKDEFTFHVRYGNLRRVKSRLRHDNKFTGPDFLRGVCWERNSHHSWGFDLNLLWCSIYRNFLIMTFSDFWVILPFRKCSVWFLRKRHPRLPAENWICKTKALKARLRDQTARRRRRWWKRDNNLHCIWINIDTVARFSVQIRCNCVANNFPILAAAYPLIPKRLSAIKRSLHLHRPGKLKSFRK